MNFLITIHRSIVDPSFYKEIAAFRRRKVVFYFLKLLLLTVLVTAAAHAFYLVHPQRGIAQKIETVFSGMEIVDGVLNPNCLTPYYPPSYLLTPILEQLLGTGSILSDNPDSMLVIDTSNGSRYPFNVTYALKKNELSFIFNNVELLRSPYDKLFHNTKHFKFTAEDIRQTLLHNISDIFLSCIIMSFFQNMFLLIFSIFFLAIAAFIFRVEGDLRFSFFLRAACYAVTPIAVGIMMIGLSGVRISWTWHILIFISTIVMFRAIIASTKPKNIENDLL